MAQYLKPNRDAKTKKKMKSSKKFDDDFYFSQEKNKKKNKPNLKRMREKDFEY